MSYNGKKSFHCVFYAFPVKTDENEKNKPNNLNTNAPRAFYKFVINSMKNAHSDEMPKLEESAITTGATSTSDERVLTYTHTQRNVFVWLAVAELLYSTVFQNLSRVREQSGLLLFLLKRKIAILRSTENASEKKIK